MRPCVQSSLTYLIPETQGLSALLHPWSAQPVTTLFIASTPLTHIASSIGALRLIAAVSSFLTVRPMPLLDIENIKKQSIIHLG